MNSTILSLTLILALTAPAFGQTVYKCPQPDGKVSYQRAPCAEGGKMAVRDNGKASGNAEQGQGLRPGEQAILDNAQQRDAAEYSRRQQQEEAQQPHARVPGEMSYDDRHALQEVNDKLERAATTRFSTAGQRAAEMRTLRDEQRQIYHRAGVASPIAPEPPPRPVIHQPSMPSIVHLGSRTFHCIGNWCQ